MKLLIKCYRVVLINKIIKFMTLIEIESKVEIEYEKVEN